MDRKFLPPALILVTVVTSVAWMFGCAPAPAPNTPVNLTSTPVETPTPVTTPTSVATPVATPPPVTHPLRDGLINLTHLQRLTEIVQWQGESIALVHIYSEAPDYNWVDASGEGIACVDDAARAAIVYTLYYVRTGDPYALELARAALNFVIYMQAEDGEYYNFVLDRSGTVNREGRTSYKSWNWWAARAQWALATAIPVFRQTDPDYARRLEDAYLRGEEALQRIIGAVGAYDTLHGTEIPAWLISGGSDLTALAVLGLAAYYESEPNTRTRHLLTNLANGVAAYRSTQPHLYPFGAFPSSTSSTVIWHAWGSHQVHALAEAGRLLNRSDWIQAARFGADTFYVRLLATDFLNEMNPLPVRGGQIAYGIEVMTSGFWSLYRATGEEKYARYAGLSNAWFFGNNMAGVAMYDPETGRGFDGINGPTIYRVNFNAGAESTIEALYALLTVGDHPLATAYYNVRPTRSPFSLILEAEMGRPLSGRPNPGRWGWTGEARFSNDRYYALRPGEVITIGFQVPADGDYWIYASHWRRAAPPAPKLAQALRTDRPIVVDGHLDEWEIAQPLRVDSREHILRGAASWPGPEKASFVLRFLWDDTFLYVAAEVRDDQHVQKETGPSVWRGDALWLYFNTLGDRSRVDVKLTLAQTPAGPQVWNWTAQGFLPDAQLAWKEQEGGYAYEAALPWKSLNMLDPLLRPRIFFDTGIGFGGVGFIDWSGLDPDTPSNLQPLDFVTELSPQVFQPTGEAQNPLDVAFSVSIDDGPVWTLPQAVSPDRDYLWLEPVTEAPIPLKAGDHTMFIRYAGWKEDREAIVDAFWILPTVVCKEFHLPTHPSAQSLRLCYNVQTGESSWEEW